MEKKIVAILGASDPEMEMIESLLRECGVTVIHALNERGERVKPHEAYRAAIPDVGDATEVWAVECIDTLPDGWIRIDHHRPGDPGYGLGPEDFLKASSIGQVIALLGRLNALPAWARVKRKADADQSFELVFEHCSGVFMWHGTHYVETGILDIPFKNEFAIIPKEYMLCAAADHCLAHAYAGRCLGVKFDALLDWRIASKAKFQNRSEADIRREIAFSRDAIQKAPKIKMGHEQIADMRDLRVVTGFYKSSGMVTSRKVKFDSARQLGEWMHESETDYYIRVEDKLPELPEGGTLEGIPYLAVGLGGPDGKTKVICQGARPETITYFMETWGPDNGLTGIYGMPERGIAGGYLIKE